MRPYRLREHELAGLWGVVGNVHKRCFAVETTLPLLYLIPKYTATLNWVDRPIGFFPGPSEAVVAFPPQIILYYIVAAPFSYFGLPSAIRLAHLVHLLSS